MPGFSRFLARTVTALLDHKLNATVALTAFAVGVVGDRLQFTVATRAQAICIDTVRNQVLHDGASPLVA